MYNLDIIGSGSGYNAGVVCLSKKDPLYQLSVDAMSVWQSADNGVYWIYGLVDDSPENKALDHTICELLGINPSNFTKHDIHLLEVNLLLWDVESPEVHLYYGGVKVTNLDLKSFIAKKLLNHTNTHYLFDDCGDYSCGPTGFLDYAMKLILANEKN